MKKKVLIAGTVILMGILYLKVVSPKLNIHIPCLFNKVTGYECPGCGITRASLALLDGNFYQAFRYNMLLFILTPLYVLHAIFEKVSLIKQRNIIMTTMLVLSALFFILRNTQKFSWLSPTILG